MWKFYSAEPMMQCLVLQPSSGFSSKKGETEKCRSFIYALAQFDVRTIDFGAKDNALHIAWLSDTELSVWHRSFATSQGKNYIGPDVQHSQANSPIKVIFSPLAAQIGMPSQIKNKALYNQPLYKSSSFDCCCYAAEAYRVSLASKL